MLSTLKSFPILKGILCFVKTENMVDLSKLSALHIVESNLSF